MPSQIRLSHSSDKSEHKIHSPYILKKTMVLDYRYSPVERNEPVLIFHDLRRADEASLLIFIYNEGFKVFLHSVMGNNTCPFFKSVLPWWFFVRKISKLPSRKLSINF